MTVIVRQPRSLSSFGYQQMAEGARFEAPTGAETIGRDRISLVRSQQLTEESEADDEPINPDRTR
jgi:hypothetical protein